MSRSYIVVDIQSLHIGFNVRGCLCPVDQYFCSHCMGLIDDGGYRVNCPQGIGDVIDKNKLGFVT